MKFIHIFAKICQNNDGEAHFLHIKSCSINCRCESTLEVCPNILYKLSQGVSTTFFELYLPVSIISRNFAIFATEDAVRLLFFFGLANVKKAIISTCSAFAFLFKLIVFLLMLDATRLF